MSSESFAIEAQNLSKQYSLFTSPTDRIVQSLKVRANRLLQKPPPSRSGIFNALSNVSFNVPRGSTVGIVGRNGSGKSTLLQLVCGTLNPTSGDISVNGRIAALLELGAGFNPEYSGRENVFLNAAILGMSRDETEQKLDDILSFADIGQFIDQPVKTYSSGMFVRLAFATAINTNPDILIIDEALAVGDEAFQRKCFAKIHQIQESGSTILFVSHSAQSVIELCDSAILLDQGEVLMDGDPKSVTAQYQKLVHAPPDQVEGIRTHILESDHTLTDPTELDTDSQNFHGETKSDQTDKDELQRPGMEFESYDPNLVSQSRLEYLPQGATIREVKILNLESKQRNILVYGETYVCQYEVEFEQDIENVKFAMALKTISGFEIFSQWSAKAGSGHSANAYDTLTIRLPFKNALLPGTYFLNVGVFVEQSGEFVQTHRIVDALSIRVAPFDFETQRYGVVNLHDSDQAQTISIDVVSA